jgi:hypothetical protein
MHCTILINQMYYILSLYELNTGFIYDFFFTIAVGSHTILGLLLETVGLILFFNFLSNSKDYNRIYFESVALTSYFYPTKQM